MSTFQFPRFFNTESWASSAITTLNWGNDPPNRVDINGWSSKVVHAAASLSSNRLQKSGRGSRWFASP